MTPRTSTEGLPPPATLNLVLASSSCPARFMTLTTNDQQFILFIIIIVIIVYYEGLNGDYAGSRESSATVRFDVEEGSRASTLNSSLNSSTLPTLPHPT
jgi:hypothetical protein